MTKKEALMVKKQITKLDKNLAGIKDLNKLPDDFIVDTGYERTVTQEATNSISQLLLADSNNFDSIIRYLE